MRPGGGRQKGNNFELKLARMLSAWWGQPGTDALLAKELWFRRVPLSGGFDKRKAAGDIWSVADEAQNFPFSIELKNREEWDWDGLFKRNEKWPVWTYWEQCCSDAAFSKKVPLLLFSKNRHPIHGLLPHEMTLRFGLDPERVVVTSYKGQIVSFFLFEDLTKVSKDRILMYAT